MSSLLMAHAQGLPALCPSCKHHTSTPRPTNVSVADDELELIETDGEKPFYSCVAANREHPSERGFEDACPTSCSGFENGKRPIDPELERLMAQSAERASRGERRGQ